MQSSVSSSGWQETQPFVQVDRPGEGDGDRQRSGAMDRAVRRAEALIVARPEESYSTGRLARAVGVSARTLTRGFQRLRGYSPMAAVRRARLQRVRVELLTSGQAVKVTDAAMRWGFFHLGRFSALYCRHFGELPSVTRRRCSV